MNQCGQQLAGGLGQYTGAVGQLNQGGQKVFGGLNELNGKSGQLQAGGANADVSANLKSMASQIESLAGLESADNLTDSQKQTLSTNVKGLQDNLNSVQSKLSGASSQNSNLSQLAAGYDQLYAGMTSAFGNVAGLADGAGKVNGGLTALQQKNDSLTSGS